MTVETAQLRKALDSVAAIDCHNILKDHLERVRGIAKALPDASGEGMESMLLRLQLSVNSYFHFLSRLNPEQQVLQTKLTAIKSQFAYLIEVDDGLKGIENEFREAINQLIRHVSGLEGSSLLSWVHQIRYYLTRAIAKLDDLSDWAASLVHIRSCRGRAKDEARFLANGWPELTSQSLSLLEKLDSEFSRSWSFGNGRKTKPLSIQLEKAVKAQEEVTKNVLDLQSIIDSLIRALLPSVDDRVKTVIREYEKLLDSPTPRLEYLVDNATEILRQKSVNESIAHIDTSFEKRLSRIRGRKGVHDWLEMLRVEHAGLVPTNEVSQHVLPVFETAAPLIEGLRNAEQRDELALRRESLVRTLIETELTLDDHTVSSSEHVDWFLKRLTVPRAKRRKEVCAQFSEAILLDDKPVQCKRCGAYCHPECLAGGTCPVCNEPIL